MVPNVLVRAPLMFALGIVLLHYIFRAFRVVWTYPFETLSKVIHVVRRLIGVIEFMITRPFMTISLVFFVVPAVIGVLGVVLLLCLRYLSPRGQGVPQGSYVANHQSMMYGGNVPRNSTFARFQSQGAKGGGTRYRAVDGTGSPSWGY